MTAIAKTDYQTGYSGVTHTAVAAFLQRTLTSAEQTLATSLIADVEAEICHACGRQFKASDKTYYELFRSGLSLFRLENYPVASISAIYVDGVDVTSDYDEGVDYYILDEVEVLFDSPLDASSNLYTGVRIEYAMRQFWGADLTSLIKKWVAQEFLASADGGVKLAGKSFAGSAENFDRAAFEKEKARILARYQSHIV